ncbi:MAG: MAPEG family protein [Myxococcota bacterium]|nr:MAPEG family protein [Myxococcota bacterium]
MTTELGMLVLTALLSILLAFPPLIAVISTQGFRYGLGNRELGSEALPEWGKRAERAHLNLLANLPAFAVVVLVAGLAGVSNEVTEIGAQGVGETWGPSPSPNW